MNLFVNSFCDLSNQIENIKSKKLDSLLEEYKTEFPLPEYPGTLPVRVLLKVLNDQIGNYSDSVQELMGIADSFSLKLPILYHIADVNEIFPYCISEPDGLDRVHFSQEFLTYLWTYSYFAITEFEGNIQKKANRQFDKYEVVSREMRERAHQLYNWGTSVCSNPKPDMCWPWNYPSPFPLSSLPPEEIGYCLLANNICILSALFCIFHEFGHVVLGHLEIDHTKQHEIEADSFAAKMLLNTQKTDKTSVGIAMIVALESELLDFDNPAQRYNPSHPDAVCRVNNILDILDKSGFEKYTEGLQFMKALFLKEYCLNCNIVEKDFFSKNEFQTVEDVVFRLETIIND